MRDGRRKESVRRRAQRYAPAPVDTRLTYGSVAASIMLVATIVGGAFYGIDLEPHLAAVAVLATVAFVAGLLVRQFQALRHRRVHRVW